MKQFPGACLELAGDDTDGQPWGSGLRHATVLELGYCSTSCVESRNSSGHSQQTTAAALEHVLLVGLVCVMPAFVATPISMPVE